MKVDTNMSIVNKKYVRFMWYPANKVMAKTVYSNVRLFIQSYLL